MSAFLVRYSPEVHEFHVPPEPDVKYVIPHEIKMHFLCDIIC